MMLLRGYSLDNTRVDFDIASCPVTVSEECIALLGDKGSRLLKAGTLIRGDKSTGIFEGDIVYDNGTKIGIVVYSKGFVMQDLNGTIKKIPKGQHIKVEEGNSETAKKAASCEEKSALLLQYKDTLFPIQSLMFKTDGMLVSSQLVGTLIDPNDLMYSTGFDREDGTALCFGEFYKGGTIVLHDYLPCLKLSETEFVKLKNL